MSFDAICPECDKSLRLRDELLGKKVKCPNCDIRFVARSDDDYAIEEDSQARPKKRSRRQDSDDEDDDPPRKKKRSGDVQQVPTPVEPIIWAVLSLACPLGLIGIIIASIALTKARNAIGDLPAGRRGDSARRNLNIVTGVACVGMLFSVGVLVVAVILKVTNRL